ncbi:uncharacterized protein LOC106874009 [Octopus bimaculoides]|uniref:uncharacterized protein LOC106874009 n=1 Tax=Octopus bimaculoides TaxID=37653 RepID=UPI00071CA68B|nr:uncharacterized protein LOC106874009 [Octopus bimaculoides]|eukprot:XP_014777055.1 PREDICTED: uncharacterized protein LOC106874009 [Octopus bimaculoides]
MTFRWMTCILSIMIILLYSNSNCANADEALKRVQSRCKEEMADLHADENCEKFKVLLTCVAKSNTSFVNEFVQRSDLNCRFSPEFIESLQRYQSTESQTVTKSTDTQDGSYASKTFALIIVPIVMSSISVLTFFALYN